MNVNILTFPKGPKKIYITKPFVTFGALETHTWNFFLDGYAVQTGSATMLLPSLPPESRVRERSLGKMPEPLYCKKNWMCLIPNTAIDEQMPTNL